LVNRVRDAGLLLTIENTVLTSHIPSFFKIIEDKLVGQAAPTPEGLMAPPADQTLNEYAGSSTSYDNKTAVVPSTEFFKASLDRILTLKADGRVNCILAINNMFLATGYNNGKVRIWHLETGKCARLCDGHEGPIHALAVFRTRNDQTGVPKTKLLSAGQDGHVILWNLDDQEDNLVFQGHQNAISCLLDIRDGNTFVSGSYDKNINVYDVKTTSVLATVSCAAGVLQLSLMKSKKRFISTDQSNTICIWGIQYTKLVGHSVVEKLLLERKLKEVVQINSIGVSNVNHNIFATTGADRLIKVWPCNSLSWEQGYDTPERIIEGFPTELGDFALLETSNPANEQSYRDFIVIGLARGSSALIVKHPKDNFSQNYMLTDPTLNAHYVINQHKMQIIKGLSGELKLIAVNQSEDDPRISIWDLKVTP
jgi:WD40 repeat protein